MTKAVGQTSYLQPTYGINVAFSFLQEQAKKIGRAFENAVVSVCEQLRAQFVFIGKKVTLFTINSALSFTLNSRLATCVNQNKALGEKVDALTSATFCKEAAKFFATYAAAYFKEAVVRAKEYELQDRPHFVQSLVQETNAGLELSLEGEIAENVVSEHENAIQALVEANILRMMYSFLSAVDTLEKKAPFALLDKTIDIASKLALYFVTAHTLPNEIIKQEFDEHLLTEIILMLFLPKGADSLYLFDLPYISSPLFENLRSSVIPTILKDIFQKLDSQDMKEELLLSSFKAMKTFVNDVHDLPPDAPVSKKVDYPRQAELNEALYKLLASFMQCVDPEPLEEIGHFTKPDDIKLALGKGVVQALYGKSLIPLFNQVLQAVLAKVQPEKKAPFVFIYKRADFEKKAKEDEEHKRKVHEELEKTVQEVGVSSQGLLQVADSVLTSPLTALAQKMAQKQSLLQDVERFFKKAADAVEEGVDKIKHEVEQGLASFVVSYLAKKVHILSGEIYTTLKQPIHNKLLPSLTKEVICLFKPVS